MGNSGYMPDGRARGKGQQNKPAANNRRRNPTAAFSTRKHAFVLSALRARVNTIGNHDLMTSPARMRRSDLGLMDLGLIDTARPFSEFSYMKVLTRSIFPARSWATCFSIAVRVSGLAAR
jgi:hypothetical protein